MFVHGAVNLFTNGVKWGKIKYGRIDFKCQMSNILENQRNRDSLKNYYSDCKVKLSLTEQEDGTWMTVNCQVDKHDGHPISEEVFMI